MSRLQDPVTQFDPIDKVHNRFVKEWEDWFRQVATAVGDLQNSQPVFSQGFSLISGPGPVSVTVTLTVQRAATLNIWGTIMQQWATAAPSWLLEVLIDNNAFWTSGTVTNTWQNILSLSTQKAVAAGTHTVTLRWTTGNANATLSVADICVIPVLV